MSTYISPAVPAIPPSIGIKYSQITVQTKLLQSLSIQEQVICPPSCRAVLVAVRQRYHHICACNEELGRAGGGFNEIVSSLPSLDLADGQVDPRKQGRAMPHNLATIQNGTGDGWIVMDEFDPARRRTGDNIYVKGVPTVDMCTSAAERAKSYNKYSNDTAGADTLTFLGTGGAETVSTPKLADVEKEVTTHLECEGGGGHTLRRWTPSAARYSLGRCVYVPAAWCPVTHRAPPTSDSRTDHPPRIAQYVHLERPIAAPRLRF
jgi:hypothetical protein